MRAKVGYRAWYYFRMGWSTYFAFVFAALNTLVVTYYLAIENIPELQTIFPSFFSYLGIAMLVGIPLLVLIGYIHFKKIPAYSSELDVGIYSNPWLFKVMPGYNLKVVFPMYRILTLMLLKLSNDEKLNDDEISEIKKLLNDLDHLIKGGYVDKPKGMS
jgi:hypothetical protein